MGVLLAITALLSWGLGDFLIQRSTRRFGDWVALFYITAFGAIILFPFAYPGLRAAIHNHPLLLLIACLVLLFAALFDFEAMRIGKLSVVEPIFAFEIPVTAFLAAYFIKELLTPGQVFFTATLIAGIFLVSARSPSYLKNIRLEKGTWYAVLGTIGLGASSFLFGLGARETNPLVINWITDAFIAIVSILYLALTSRLGGIWSDFRNNKRLILNVSFFDKLAWVTFSYATLFIPIAVATGISEGYIAFAAGLGLMFNKEKLRLHQWIGLLLAIASVIVLALTTAG
ncbi:MAG: DMT family transporter [Minisyncoccia bacterium]|jgi:drug/metabolite transporter (DMT)-like permease